MWLVEAVEPASGDGQTAIILGIIALLTAVGVAVVTGLFSLLSAKANRTTAAPPSAAATPASSVDLAFRDSVVGQLARCDQRHNDSDERDDIQDRELRNQRDTLDAHHGRLRRIERHLDLTEWS